MDRKREKYLKFFSLNFITRSIFLWIQMKSFKPYEPFGNILVFIKENLIIAEKILFLYFHKNALIQYGIMKSGKSTVTHQTLYITTKKIFGNKFGNFFPNVRFLTIYDFETKILNIQMIVGIQKTAICVIQFSIVKTQDIATGLLT